MIWMDLAIICVCLWGGIKGIWSDTGKLFRSIIIIIISIGFANLLQLYLAKYMINELEINHAIKAMLFQNQVIPVYTSDYAYFSQDVMQKLNIPSFWEEKILLRIKELGELTSLDGHQIYLFLNEFIYISVEIISFGLILFLAIYSINMINYVVEYPDLYNKGKWYSFNWLGAGMGLMHHFLLISLVVGFLSFLLCYLPFINFISLENSLLASLCMEVFFFLKIW